MTEEEVILCPHIVQEIGRIVVAPISSQDEVYQLCEAVVNAYFDNGDSSCLEMLLQEGLMDGDSELAWTLRHHATTKNIPLRLKNVIKRNPSQTSRALIPIALAASPVAAVPISFYSMYEDVKAIHKLYKQYKDRPKSFIAKKIASLRRLYEVWLHRAKIEKDDKTAGLMKTIATNIMILIDKLLEHLQRGADKIMA